MNQKKKNTALPTLPEDTGKLQKLIDTQSDALKILTQTRSDLADRVSQINARPFEISKRLSEIKKRQSELKEFFNQPAASDSAQQTAQNLELLSERYALTTENAMLLAEEKSIPDRLATFEAELNYQNEVWNVESKNLKNLRIEQAKINQSEAQKTISTIKTFNFPNNPDLVEAAANLEELIKQYETSVNQRNQVAEFDAAIIEKTGKDNGRIRQFCGRTKRGKRRAGNGQKPVLSSSGNP